MTILLALYAAGACVLLVRLAVGWHGCRNIARSAAEMDDPHWLSRFDCWQARLGLPAQRGKRSVRRPSVRLLCSERIAVPATLGIWRRAVVIPASLSSARRETVDAILAHELAHIARDDLAWLVIERIVEAVYWFHPLVWIARRRIAFVRERACDEFAIAGLGDSATYANVLLDLAANASHRRLGLAVPFLRRGNLAARITAIQSSRGTDHWSLPASGRWMLGGGSVMIALLMASMVLRPAQAEEPKPAPPEPPIAQAARDDKPEPLVIRTQSPWKDGPHDCPIPGRAGTAEEANTSHIQQERQQKDDKPNVLKNRPPLALVNQTRQICDQKETKKGNTDRKGAKKDSHQRHRQGLIHGLLALLFDVLLVSGPSQERYIGAVFGFLRLHATALLVMVQAAAVWSNERPGR